jgi:hypothetical protein
MRLKRSLYPKEFYVDFCKHCLLRRNIAFWQSELALGSGLKLHLEVVRMLRKSIFVVEGGDFNKYTVPGISM